MNLLQCQVVPTATAPRWQRRRLELSAVARRTPGKAQRSAAGEVVLGARHSTIAAAHRGRARTRIPGRVYTVEPTGDVTYAHV